MKSYSLSKTTLFGLQVKEVHYNKKTSLKSFKKPKSIIIHHTQTLNTLEKVLNNYVKKFKDTSIGYHIMIGKNGQFYLTRPLKFEGNHASFLNKNTFGIALFGDFNKKKPNDKQIQSLKKICSLLKKKYNISSVLTHNEAAYDLLKKSSKEILPEMNKKTIQDDISYYSFLKKVYEIVKNNREEEISVIMNEMKACPGLHLQQKISELEL